MLKDGFDSIVAPCGAFFAKAKGAEGQGDVVVNDEHLFRRPLVKREDLLDGPAAQVHESLGFEQEDAAAGELREVALPFRTGLKYGTRGGGEAVQYHEPDVVAGVFILLAGIPEADDEGEGHLKRLMVDG